MPHEYVVRGRSSASQEEGSPQTPDLLAPWSCTSQPPELWEIKVCCLRHSINIMFCYSNPGRLRLRGSWYSSEPNKVLAWGLPSNSELQTENKGTMKYHVCLVAQPCLTLRDPMDCSQPGSSVQGILQARMLEWAAIPFSRGSSRSRDQAQASCTGSWVLYRPRHQGSSKYVICQVSSLTV